MLRIGAGIKKSGDGAKINGCLEVEQETDEPEMNTYEIPEGHSNITCEETSSHVDSHTQL